MPKEKLSMRKVREVLRLNFDCKKSQREIAQSCGIARSTVGDYLIRFQATGLNWPLPEELTEEKLEGLLFSSRGGRGPTKRPLPDCSNVHTELKKKGVTLMLLWSEYKSANPEGCQYSQFCNYYRAWKNKLDPCLRQHHKAGEKLFVDYCGQSVPVTNPQTGEIKEAQIFVAVWGASNYTYAEATGSQKLPDWIGSHVRALKFFQGCPEIIVPDNLRSGVDKTCRYEPDINPTYQSFASHYEIAVIPARVRKPKDKSKVEKGVQTVENWILARLRNRTFFSLTELNQAMAQGLNELNDRPFQKMPGSRKSLYESLERPILKPLPINPYEYSEWEKARVNIDYHIEVHRHYYSVPHTHIRRQVEVRLTAKTLEIFYRGERIASHVRSYKEGSHTTLMEHMPKSHREYLSWPPERLQQWGAKIGCFTAQIVTQLLERSSHPIQGYRSSLGILRLSKEFGEERLEKACERALLIQAISYKSIRSILKKGLDRLPSPQPPPPSSSVPHDNIRGSNYFN